MFKNNYELIAEACKGEKASVVDMECDATKSMCKGIFDDLDSLDIEIAFTPAMVPVIKSNFTEEYYMDSTDLARLAEANNVEMEDAFYAVVKENGLDPMKCVVVIESEEEVFEMIAEAKGNAKKLGVVGKAAKKLEQLKKKGINLKKKKAKGKK